MIAALFVIGSLMFMGASLRSSLSYLENKVDINVFMIMDADETDILALKKSLEALPEVQTVVYTSKADALRNFQERHKADQTALRAIEEIGYNPLGAELNITAKNASQYASIATFLEGSGKKTQAGTEIIRKVNYNDNKIAIEKLNKVIDVTERAGLGVAAILVFIAILITFNTIRLTIYASREEIAVMRLVGANNSYIRGPFVVSGIMYGVIAGIITLIIFYPITFSLRDISHSFTELNIFHYYLSQFPLIFGVIVGSGIVIGAISSYLACRRYLKI